MKILIIQLSGIGDAVMALPMINKISRVHPNAKIDILVDKSRGTFSIYETNEKINKIYTMDVFYGNNIKKIFHLYYEARSLGGYDIAYATYPGAINYTALLMFFCAKKRVQHERGGTLEFLLSKKIKTIYAHAVEQNLNLVDGENLQSDFVLNYKVDNESEKFADEFLSKFNEKKLIGVHPGGFKNMSYKRLANRRWNELFSFIQEQNQDVVFFIFSGPSDDLEGINLTKSFVKLENLELKKTIALISRMNAFVSNDSGLAHIASMFSLKEFVLFGATDPTYCKPFSKNAIAIIPSNFKPFYVPHIGLTGKINENINEIDLKVLSKQILDVI